LGPGGPNPGRAAENGNSNSGYPYRDNLGESGVTLGSRVTLGRGITLKKKFVE
jgi:hypothetical protein